MKSKTYLTIAPPAFTEGDRVRLTEMGSFILRRPAATKGTVTKRGICTITVLIDGEQREEAWSPDLWEKDK